MKNARKFTIHPCALIHCFVSLSQQPTVQYPCSISSSTLSYPVDGKVAYSTSGRAINRIITLERFSKPNIRFGSGRTGSKIVSKFRLTHNRKLRSANRKTIDHTIACPALLLWCLAVENPSPCVPKKCSLYLSL